MHAVGGIHGRIDLDTGAYRRDILTSLLLAGVSRGFLQTRSAAPGTGPAGATIISDVQKG